MKKDKDKKLTYFLRAAMMVLTTILIVLFLVIMSMVGKIQGTARVVNYAGLVRGGTQRMVKLEISGAPQDKMYRRAGGGKASQKEEVNQQAPGRTPSGGLLFVLFVCGLLQLRLLGGSIFSANSVYNP